MKFSICNEMFENWNLEDVMESAKSIGYDGVEIAPFTICDNVKEVSAEGRKDIAEKAGSIGIDIVGLHWLLVKPEGLYINHPDESIRRETYQYLQELTRFCGDIGGKVMVIGSPKQRNVVEGITYERAWELAKDSFKRCLPTAEEKGVTLCIEALAPEETDFINTVDEALRMVDEIDHPRFKAILDVKAMSTEGKDIPEIIRRAEGRFGHVHANDANKLGPGFGDTDFRPIAKALRDTGYDGYVSVEVFDFSPGPVNIAKKSLKYLNQVFNGD